MEHVPRIEKGEHSATCARSGLAPRPTCPHGGLRSAVARSGHSRHLDPGRAASCSHGHPTLANCTDAGLGEVGLRPTGAHRDLHASSRRCCVSGGVGSTPGHSPRLSAGDLGRHAPSRRRSKPTRSSRRLAFGPPCGADHPGRCHPSSRWTVGQRARPASRVRDLQRHRQRPPACVDCRPQQPSRSPRERQHPGPGRRQAPHRHRSTHARGRRLATPLIQPVTHRIRQERRRYRPGESPHTSFAQMPRAHSVVSPRPDPG